MSCILFDNHSNITHKSHLLFFPRNFCLCYLPTLSRILIKSLIARHNQSSKQYKNTFIVHPFWMQAFWTIPQRQRKWIEHNINITISIFRFFKNILKNHCATSCLYVISNVIQNRSSWIQNKNDHQNVRWQKIKPPKTPTFTSPQSIPFHFISFNYLSGDIRLGRDNFDKTKICHFTYEIRVFCYFRCWFFSFLFINLI